MRPSLIFLTLFTLAAAGPLPSSSKIALEARAVPSTAANYALDPDTVASLTQLKAAYDNLNPNEKRMEGGLIAKRGFWWWLKMAFEAPGLKARSSNSPSMPANMTLDPTTVASLTQLKAVYDSLNVDDNESINVNEKRTEGGLIEKRGFWHWLKMAFEAPGLKARSSNLPSMPANTTLDPTTVASLTQLKAVYDSLNTNDNENLNPNEKRMESGPIEKRGFWHWLKMAFDETPQIVE